MVPTTRAPIVMASTTHRGPLVPALVPAVDDDRVPADRSRGNVSAVVSVMSESMMAAAQQQRPRCYGQDQYRRPCRGGRTVKSARIHDNNLAISAGGRESATCTAVNGTVPPGALAVTRRARSARMKA